MRFAFIYIHNFNLGHLRSCGAHPDSPDHCSSYEEIQNIPDRLRWCRHGKGMTQREVAEQIGMSLNGYKAMEEGYVRCVPKELARRLAGLYNVSAADFADEYNRFLLDGQACRIKTCRQVLCMGQKAFARHMGIPLSSLREWEKERKVISRKSWEKYFEGRA